MVDLHIHSSFSDGKNTPTEIIELSRELGIKTISITDHYSLDAYNDLKSFPDDIRIIPGIELGEGDIDPYHILGYNINIEHPSLISALTKINKSKMLMIIAFLKILKKRGIHLYIDGLKNERKLDVGAILLKLVDIGCVGNKKEALNLFEEDLHILSDKYCFSTTQKINLIKEAGGVAVFAHPFKTINENILLQQKVSEFKKSGLDGLEVYHPSHDKSQVSTLFQLSKQFNLLVTGGSDFHELTIEHQRLGLYRGVAIPEILL